MARPRTLSDEALLAAIGIAMAAADSSWTLNGAAEAAGVHPATLIKRFGSRRGVLLALSRRWVEGLPTAPLTDDAHAELLHWVASLSTSGETPVKVLARVDMLAEDLSDQELRLLLHEGWARQLNYLAGLVEGIVLAGQLHFAAPPQVVAALLMDSGTGALLRAAVAPNPTDVDPAVAVLNLLEALT